MKGVQPFVFILHSSLLLIVITVKLPQPITSGDVNNLGQSHILQLQGVEEAQQTHIPTYYDFFGLQDAPHPNIKSHLPHNEREIIQKINSETPHPDFQLSYNFQDGTVVPDQPIGSHHLNELGTHERFHKENLIESYHPRSVNVVTHTTNHNEDLEFDLETPKKSLHKNTHESDLEADPDEGSQGISKEIKRLGELKSIDQTYFLYLLQKEGKLAIREFPGLYEEISSTFGSLIRSTNLRYGESHNKNEHFAKSIQKIKNELLTRLVGGLMVIFQNSQTKPSVGDLIVEGWDVLFQELKRAILLPYKRYHNQVEQKADRICHDALIDFLLQKRGVNPISPDLIMSLIDQWARKTSYNHHIHGTELENSIAEKEVFPVGDKEGLEHKGVATSPDVEHVDTSSVQIGNLYGSSSHTMPNDVMYKRRSHRCIDFLIDLGRQDIKMPKDLKERIANFFVNLQSKILPLSTDSTWSTKIGNSSGSKNIYITTRICETIKLMPQQITPAFLAILWLTHQDQVKDTSWNTLCINGWSFLEGFFLSWKELVLANPEASFWQSERDQSQSFDFSGSQGPAQYMRFIQTRGYLTKDPLWYLVNQWYETLKGQSEGISGALGYNLDQPRRSVIDYIHNKHVRQNNTGKRRKFSGSEPTQRGDETLPFDPPSKLGRFLGRYAKWKMENKKEFSAQISSFFNTLHQDLSKAFETAEGVYLKFKPSNSHPSLNKYMITNAIQTAESQIVPQFLAIMILLYNLEEDNRWKSVCGSGWEFLKDYFSGWTEWLQEAPLQAMVLLDKEKGTMEDWSSMQYSFHYMAKHVLKDGNPFKPTLFLIEKWYETQVDADGSTFSSLGFDIPPPNERTLKKIVKDYQTKV